MISRTESRRNIGADAEEAALRYLVQAGLSLVTRNYRCQHGEIDLVMRDREALVFVEVRFRGRRDFGTASESVDWRKQSRLRATAEHFLQRDREASMRPCRFDIVAVTPGAEGTSVEWLRDAF